MNIQQSLMAFSMIFYSSVLVSELVSMEVNAQTEIRPLERSIEVDKALEEHAYAVPQAMRNQLSFQLICDLPNEGTIEFSPGFSSSLNAQQDSLLVNLSDGDQVLGFIFSLKDLIQLRDQGYNLPLKNIAPRYFYGYWWADGNYYQFHDQNALCKVL